jgi:hypothetical protein
MVSMKILNGWPWADQFHVEFLRIRGIFAHPMMAAAEAAGLHITFRDLIFDHLRRHL